MTQKSYQFNLSPAEIADFKSDLRDFAGEKGYDFIDGGSETKKSREYINEKSETLSGKNPGLVSEGADIIDVTVEPREPGSDFLVFAKTSAKDAEEVSLTVVYDKGSVTDRKMLENFVQSRFLQKWN